MANLHVPGEYNLDEDGVLSEDDRVESRALGQDDDEDLEPVLLINISHVFGDEPENAPFHATPEDIARVRSMFTLPPELVTKILDLAEYWVYSQGTCSDSGQFRHADVRYLQSKRIQGGEFTYPLRRVVVTTNSRDQGWSSYPETQGTRDGSWTWFELTLDDGMTDNEIVRVEVVRNIHAGEAWETYRAVIEDERILKQAKKGDRLSVWVRARFPGWCNHVRFVRIEAWTAC